MRAVPAATIDAPTLEEIRRRLRPGQPAARMIGACDPEAPPNVIRPIMGHGKANLSPGRSIRSSTPEPSRRQNFDDAAKAVAALRALYDRNTAFLRDSFAALAAGGDSDQRYRAFYPEVSVTTNSFTQVDSRQAYGHMPTPGHFTTTITQPDLFESYLRRAARA